MGNQVNRRHFYHAMEDSVKDFKTPEQVLAFANKVTSALVPHANFNLSGQHLSSYTAMAAHGGNLQDKITVLGQLCKSVGLSARTVIVPAWPHGNGNHKFVGVPKLEDGQVVDYLTVEPGDLEAFKGRKAVRAYQGEDHSIAKAFAKHPFSNFATPQNPLGQVKDITRFLTPTADLIVGPKTHLENGPKINEGDDGAYLHVMNSGFPAYVGSSNRIIEDKSGDKTIIFQDVGNARDTLYFVSDTVNMLGHRDVFSEITHPLILRKNGSMSVLDGDHSSANGFGLYTLGEDIAEQRLSPGNAYFVGMWNRGNFSIVEQEVATGRNGVGSLSNVMLSPGVAYHLFELSGPTTASPIGRPFVAEDGRAVKY